LATEAELKKQIAALKKAGIDVTEQEAQLAKLQGKAAAPAEDLFDTGMDEEEFDAIQAGSKRPSPGKYLAEITAVDTSYTPTSMKFSFTLVQPGPWSGFEDAFYSGKSKESAFKYKNICAAAGVQPVLNPKTGKQAYNFNELPGKRIFAVYELDKPHDFTGQDGVTREVQVSKASKAAPLSPQDMGQG